MFLFKEIGEDSRIGGEWGEGSRGQRGEVAQTMYTHMNKCINNKK
jgi:hypothetical protein